MERAVRPGIGVNHRTHVDVRDRSLGSDGDGVVFALSFSLNCEKRRESSTNAPRLSFHNTIHGTYPCDPCRESPDLSLVEPKKACCACVASADPRPPHSTCHGSCLRTHLVTDLLTYTHSDRGRHTQKHQQAQTGGTGGARSLQGSGKWKLLVRCLEGWKRHRGRWKPDAGRGWRRRRWWWLHSFTGASLPTEMRGFAER